MSTALFPGTDPLRVYLHRNGLVLFSNEQYEQYGSGSTTAFAGGEDGGGADSEEGAAEGEDNEGGPAAAAAARGRAGRDAGSAPDTAVPPPCHITNYAQNTHGEVWSLKQLRDHLGTTAFK